MASAAQATITAPALQVYSADAITHESGTLVRIDAKFPAAHLIQKDFWMLVLVRQTEPGSDYVFFHSEGVLRGGAETPPASAPLDDLALIELLFDSVPETDGGWLHMGPRRIEVQLPADFGSGPAEAQLVVVYEGDVLLSNPLALSLGAAP